MCNLGIFTTLVYSSPGRLRAQGILRSLSNMCGGLFSTEPYVTLVFSELEAYSEPCQIFMIKNFIRNLVSAAYLESKAYSEHLSRNILFKTLCNLDIFRNLVYSEIWYILKSKHIQNIA